MVDAPKKIVLIQSGKVKITVAIKYTFVGPKVAVTYAFGQSFGLSLYAL